MAVAGSGAEIMDKGGAGAENKYFRIRNTEKIITFLKLLAPLTSSNAFLLQ